MMKSIKYVTAIVFLAISITSFTSCNQIRGAFSRPTVEAIQQAKEMEDDLASLSDSIKALQIQIVDLEYKVGRMMDKSSAYTLIGVEFVLSLLIILYLYGKLRMKMSGGRFERAEDGMSESKVNHMIQRAMKDLAKQVNGVHKNQEEVGQRLSKLEGQGDAYSQYAQTSFQRTRPEAPKQENPNIFYMPRTRTELLFDDNKKKLAKDETTYFKFTRKNGSMAEFTFDPLENNIVGAYDDRENSLVTACEVSSKSPTPTKYKNIQSGEAELRGNIWYVTRKLKLEYV